MTNNILAIYNVIEAMPVTVGSETPTVYDLAELKNGVDMSALPVRLLLPYSDVGNTAGRMADFNIGSTSTITWTILDRLLWQPVATGAGIEEFAEDIVSYIGEYLDAANTLSFSAIADRVNPVSIRARARADIRYPATSANVYVGVDVVWEIEEDDPPG
ncbi:MAG: hypothetical protein ACE5FD_03110 [Anaerolineae bacterium]